MIAGRIDQAFQLETGVILQMQKANVASRCQNGDLERGATLIEAALFTVIALGIVIGGIVFFEQASNSARANDLVRTMAGLQSQVKALFQTQSSYGTAALTSVLISANAVPASMLNDADNDGDYDSIVNAFGGAVTVTGAGRQFTINMTKVPVDVCTRAVPFDEGGNGLVGNGIASISDGTVTDSDGLTSTEAATFCSTNASNSEVALTWTFNR